MCIDFLNNWTTTNNNFPLTDSNIEKWISVVPTNSQLRFAQKPFNVFIHFGMNTSTGREWGNGKETVEDFTISHINVHQWVEVIKKSGATGIILTCKHHDGFCLWDTQYTDFKITNTVYKKDLVKELSVCCAENGIDFGVYLSPWDMHEKSYATPKYNDYFINQLTELLSNYGRIFEVWFDGAKGADAKEFDYDWQRYYELIYSLQPDANISICGPDIRWVGNEAGKTRKSEFCVVPEYLRMAETVQKKSQHTEADAEELQQLKSTDEDLGSRDILKKSSEICWYPAEVDVSIRKGWFHRDSEDDTVKSADVLFYIYLNSIGNNCALLLNVPPSKNGIIEKPDADSLNLLGDKIKSITEHPILTDNHGELTQGFLEYTFNQCRTVNYCILREDIKKSQRIELFDVYAKDENGEFKEVFHGTVIGQRRIIPLRLKTDKIMIVIRQSRSTPFLEEVSFYG